VRGLGEDRVTTYTSKALVKLYVHMFFCNFGAISGKGEGPLLVTWIGDCITAKLCGKLMLRFHAWIAEKCTNMVLPPPPLLVYGVNNSLP
jgi:hypothetical protein